VCAAVRDLPACYTAGEPLTVRLSYEPPAGVFAVGLEDAPPTGWVVSNISDDGSWDAVNGKAKWVFFDGEPRTVSYLATPPIGQLGDVCFVGFINFDGGPDRCIGGDACIDDLNCNFHPADAPDDSCVDCPDAMCGCGESLCQDLRIELCEVVGSVCRWRSGCQDDLATTIRGVFLFLNGELYCWDDVEANWFPQTDCPQGQSENSGELATAGDQNGMAGAVTELPACYLADGPKTVHISYTPPNGTLAVGIEGIPPIGWLINDISSGGAWDAANGKVKWVFFDGIPRTVSYTTTPPVGETAVGCMNGTINYDGGLNLPIEGSVCVGVCGDANLDSDIDLNDFAVFQQCNTGQGGGTLPGCDVFDFDRDFDVDMLDWARFQAAFTGP